MSSKEKQTAKWYSGEEFVQSVYVYPRLKTITGTVWWNEVYAAHLLSWELSQTFCWFL